MWSTSGLVIEVDPAVREIVARVKKRRHAEDTRRKEEVLRNREEQLREREERLLQREAEMRWREQDVANTEKQRELEEATKMREEVMKRRAEEDARRRKEDEHFHGVLLEKQALQQRLALEAEERSASKQEAESIKARLRDEERRRAQEVDRVRFEDAVRALEEQYWNASDFKSIPDAYAIVKKKLQAEQYRGEVRNNQAVPNPNGPKMNENSNSRVSGSENVVTTSSNISHNREAPPPPYEKAVANKKAQANREQRTSHDLDEFLLVEETINSAHKSSALTRALSSTPASPASTSPQNSTPILKVTKEDEVGDEFVVLDESQTDADDPYATLKYQQQLSSASLLPSSTSSSSAPNKTIEALGPAVIRSRTLEFSVLRKEMQRASDEQYALYLARIQPLVHKTITDASTSLSLSAIGDSLASSLLGGITWSTASTWKTCSQCGQYFDRLARIHTCKVCQEALCANCIPKPTKFDLKLVGVARPTQSPQISTNGSIPPGSPNISSSSSPSQAVVPFPSDFDQVQLDVCRSCRDVIKRAARFRRWYNLKSSAEVTSSLAAYARIATLRVNVLQALTTKNPANVSFDALHRELEKTLLALNQQLQSPTSLKATLRVAVHLKRMLSDLDLRVRQQMHIDPKPAT